MVIYTALGGITSAHIGAAVAEAIGYDIRVNTLGIDGFPQISVERDGSEKFEGFEVGLHWYDQKTVFHLTNSEAIAGVKRQKSGAAYDSKLEPETFDKIQKALAELEGKVMNGRK